MQGREFVHCRRRDIEDVVVRRVDEAASRGLEVLQHHDERAIGYVVVGVPHPWRPNRKLVAHFCVEARLGDPKADLPQKLSLLFGRTAAV